jgi:amino acid transporter
MAEIRVEKKKGVPVWAILLALIILALIVWAVSSLRSRGRQQDVDHTAALAGLAQVIVLETRETFVPTARCA